MFTERGRRRAAGRGRGCRGARQTRRQPAVDPSDGLSPLRDDDEVADGLQAEGADAAVIVKPSGSASIRGGETFEQAHLVARQVSGGGHPKAAGCKPDIYDDMMDYAYHWTTEGETTKRVILAAFRRVAEQLDDESDDESDDE